MDLKSNENFRMFILPLIAHIYTYYYCRHGKQKVLAGGALWGVGALTNNQGLQKAGATVFKAGLGTKIAAHFLPQGR